jgi:hypothetical protein
MGKPLGLKDNCYYDALIVAFIPVCSLVPLRGGSIKGRVVLLSHFEARQPLTSKFQRGRFPIRVSAFLIGFSGEPCGLPCLVNLRKASDLVKQKSLFTVIRDIYGKPTPLIQSHARISALSSVPEICKRNASAYSSAEATG